MARCLIHVGTHKTGTTTLQAILKSCREELRASDIFYPLTNDERCHNSLAHLLASCSDQELDSIRIKFRELFNQQNSGFARLLLSAEEFSTRICLAKPWAGLQENFIEKRRFYLSRLKSLLIDFDSIDFYLSFRDHEEYAHSLYATKIISGQVSCSFEEFVENCSPIFNYRIQALLFEEIGTLHMIRYEDIKNDLQGEFSSWLNLPGGMPVRAVSLKKTPPLHYIYWLSRSVCGGTSIKERKLRRKFCWVMQDSEPKDAVDSSLWKSLGNRERFLSMCYDEKGEKYQPSMRTVCPFSLERAADAIEQQFIVWRRAKKGWKSIFS